MPWLIKGNDDASQNLFFVHVPRCGGTSLMHHYNVPQKVMKKRTLFGKLGMTIFFRRYKVLESANFPWKTKTSMTCLALASFAIYVLIAAGPDASFIVQDVCIAVATLCLVLFFCLSFIFTAPTIGRLTYVRRAYLLINHYLLCRFMESIEWCTGTNKTGYMMHLTARKLLDHEYLSKTEFEETTTMAIVRNPYSRMVSIYNYNKFGNLESFPAFVKDWYHNMTKPYRQTGELDEWYTPCHAIPQFEFTHNDQEGKPLVQCIIKQEELKLLKKMNDDDDEKEAHHPFKSSVSNLPEIVRRALLDMPHTNSRAGDKKWFDYYDQETLDMVHEMYQKDFDVFGYSPVLEQRSDLQPPKLLSANTEKSVGEEKAKFVNDNDVESSSLTGTESSSDESELQDVPLGDVSSKSTKENNNGSTWDKVTSILASRFDTSDDDSSTCDGGDQVLDV